MISDDLFIWAEVFFVLAKFRRYNIHGIRVRQLHSYVWYYVIICYVILKVLQRRPKMSNFVDFMGHKIVYKRYASLYFCCAVDQDDNELEVLEVIHRKQILK